MKSCLRFKNHASKPATVILLTFMSLFLSLAACKEDDITKRCCECVRPATQQGANTMSFKINGKQWSNCNVTNSGELNDFRTVMVQFLNGDYSRFDVQGRRNFEGSDYELLNIVIDDPKQEYITQSSSKNLFFVFETRGSTDYSTKYHTDTTLPYFLDITKVDWRNRVISGEFACHLIEANGGVDTATMILTEGRFDCAF